MKKWYAVDIEWDVDDPSDLNNLPKMVPLPATLQEGDVPNYLSDQFGYCVGSYKTRELDEQRYTFDHIFMAKVTHEVTFALPPGLSVEDALNYIHTNNITPDDTEPVDEDFIEDVEWYITNTENT